MKVIIETGSESHTTSSARVVAGNEQGHLYTQKKYIVKSNFVKVQGGQWPITEYNFPTGFTFIVEGNGRTGARGSSKHEFKRMYRVGDETTPIVSVEINVGLRVCDLKGRLIEIRDMLKEQQEAAKITNDGF